MEGSPLSAETLFDAVCGRIPEAMDRHKVPGVALGIVCDGHEFMRGFGVTSAAHPLPVDERTLFQIGSNTKTFTATAVMRLVEARQLDLDAPIRTYLNGFRMRDPEVTARVTMRHLMTHTGGWVGDFFPDTGAGDDALARYVSLMADLPQVTPLGTMWSYNNAAFSLAGRVIEVITGKTYEKALLELVLQPLGLTRSYLFPTDVMLHGFAVGHTVAADKSIVLSPWHIARATAAAGGIAASMRDLMRYARFHLGNGTSADEARVLSQESMTLMQTPAVAAALDTRMGLAWWIREDGGVRRVFHGGGTFGQISMLTLAPARNFGIAITTNSVNGGMVMRDATGELIPRFLGYDIPDPDEIAMAPEQTREYLARYVAALGDFELKLEDGKLMLQAYPKGGFPTSDIPAGPTPPPFHVAFVGKDRIAMIEPPMKDVQGEFLRAPDGAIKWLRWGARLHTRA